MKNKPRRQRIKRAGKSVPQNVAKNQGYTEDEKLIVQKTIQQNIDKYNCDLFKDKPFFNDITMSNEYVVFSPFKENFIKQVEGYGIEANFRLIDARERSTDAPVWVDTPFPYLNCGIIHTLTPTMKETYPGLEVGDIIYTRTILWKDSRFYENRSDEVRDYVKNQTNVTLVHFQGKFIIREHLIEGFIKKDLFLSKYLDVMVLSDVSEENGYTLEYITNGYVNEGVEEKSVNEVLAEIDKKKKEREDAKILQAKMDAMVSVNVEKITKSDYDKDEK